MVTFKDDVGRWITKCTDCGAQVFLQNEYREVKNEKVNYPGG